MKEENEFRRMVNLLCIRMNVYQVNRNVCVYRGEQPRGKSACRGHMF